MPKAKVKQRKPRTDTSHVDWKTAEVLYISGQLQLDEIAKRYGIPYTAIQGRSKRGEWKKAREAALERLKALPIKPLPIRVEPEIKLDGETSVSSHNCERVIIETTAKELAGDVWAERQVRQREIAFNKAHTAISNAVMQPPADWKEFEIADRIARRASGLDDEKQGAPTVSFAFGFLNNAQ